MAVTQTIDIPVSHRLTIDVPREVPAGKAIITFTPVPDQRSDNTAGDGLDYVGTCPLCAKSSPNAETIAAIEEGRAMMRGEIPAKRFSSLEDLLADLRS